MAINFPQANLKQCTRATAAVFNNERRAIVETDKGRVSLLFSSGVPFLFFFQNTRRSEGNFSGTSFSFGEDDNMLISDIRAKSPTRGSWNGPKCVVRQ